MLSFLDFWQEYNKFLQYIFLETVQSILDRSHK